MKYEKLKLYKLPIENLQVRLLTFLDLWLEVTMEGHQVKAHERTHLWAQTSKLNDKNEVRAVGVLRGYQTASVGPPDNITLIIDHINILNKGLELLLILFFFKNV